MSSDNKKGRIKIGFNSSGCSLPKVNKGIKFNGSINGGETGFSFNKNGQTNFQKNQFRKLDFSNFFKEDSNKSASSADSNNNKNEKGGSVSNKSDNDNDNEEKKETNNGIQSRQFRSPKLVYKTYDNYNNNNGNNNSNRDGNKMNANNSGNVKGNYFRFDDAGCNKYRNDNRGGNGYLKTNYSNKFTNRDGGRNVGGNSFGQESKVARDAIGQNNKGFNNGSFRRNTDYSSNVNGSSSGNFLNKNGHGNYNNSNANNGNIMTSTNTNSNANGGNYDDKYRRYNGYKFGDTNYNNKTKMNFSENKDNGKKNFKNTFFRKSNAVKVKVNYKEDNSKQQVIKKTTNTGGNVDKYSINSMIKGLSNNIELDTEIDDVLGNVISVKLSGINSSNSLQKEKKVRTSNKKKDEMAKVHFNVPIVREINVYNDAISLADFADQMAISVKELMKILEHEGIELNTHDVKVVGNKIIDGDTAELIAESLGHKVLRHFDNDVESEFIRNVIEQHNDLRPRAPIVTIMGHVDHGKTTLLDTIRKTSVANGEAGGITQHIGAYRTQINDRWITFLDTPGHAAFTQMRMRGAKVTDIVVIVIAADDGIMPQTEEAINHAKASNVPIIIAINKIDKPDANVEKAKQMLLKYELVPEELGGNIMVVPISAKEGKNIDKLLEAILFQADLLELKAYYDGNSNGVVIESKLDKKKGALVTVIVKNGILSQGDFVIAGEQYGRIKGMFDENGKMLKNVEPSMPVEILGLNTTPNSGELFYAVKDEKSAKQIIEYRQEKAKKDTQQSKKGISIDDILSKMNNGNESKKKVSFIIKADTKGSLEAIVDTLKKKGNDEAELNILHTGIGAVNESDVLLASTCNGTIFAFNTQKCDKKVNELAQKNGINVCDFKIIYELFDYAEKILAGQLQSLLKKHALGHAEVKAIFEISKVGKIVGCVVKDGVISRNAMVCVKRNTEIVFETKCVSLKHEKENVKDVQSGKECGVGLEKMDDIAVGDMLEFYSLTEEKKSF